MPKTVFTNAVMEVGKFRWKLFVENSIGLLKLLGGDPELWTTHKTVEDNLLYGEIKSIQSMLWFI